MDVKERLTAELAGLPVTVNQVDQSKRGYHLEVLVTPQNIRNFALLMRRLDFYLVFVSAVHLDPDMEIIYQFANYHGQCRTLGRAFAPIGDTVPTISNIFHGANWHERETRDMFGVVFAGHPFLEPLLLPEEDADLKPLLKKPAALKPAERVRWIVEPATPMAVDNACKNNPEPS
jgi:NADH-quinone oxidoreductase subunit C